MKRSTWLMLTIMCLVLSIASMFVPVLTYTFQNGTSMAFNVLQFLEPEELFVILSEYTGEYVDLSQSVVTILAVVGILAIFGSNPVHSLFSRHLYTWRISNHYADCYGRMYWYGDAETQKDASPN